MFINTYFEREFAKGGVIDKMIVGISTIKEPSICFQCDTMASLEKL